MTPRLPTLALVCLLGTHPAFAQDAQEDDEAALLDLLANETDLATRTRQNADFVPGIVSVLHGNELADLGARTVLDALALVPGIEVLRDTNGNATLRVRGIDFFFNSGNVKVLVDGLDLGAETSAQNSAILLLPIAQVERVVVIRGPGSSLHGDYAFTGLINIITRLREPHLVAEIGDGGLRRGTLSAATQQGDWRFGASLSSTWSDRFDAAGTESADERHRFGSAVIEGLGWSLKSAIIDREQMRIVLQGQPPAPSPRRRFERVHTHELRYTHSVAAERQAEFWLSRQDADSRDGPNSYAGADLAIGSEALWRIGQHLLLAEATLTRRNIDNANSIGAPGAPPIQTIAPRSDRRHLWSLVLQDQFDLGERFTLTGGLRFDKLDGVDQRLTPRVALVWRVDARHTIKAQYAEGFRTPTFIELFSPGPGLLSDLEFEAIATSELGWHWRGEVSSLRATAFHSEVDNLIMRLQAPAAGHANLGSVRAIGMEVEAEQRLGDRWRLTATASKASTRDTRNAREQSRVTSFGEPDWLGNLAVVFVPWSGTSLGLHWNHVGDRSNPGALDLPGYDRVDAAWTQQLRPDLRLRVALRNLLDDEIVYVSRLPPNRLQTNDYSERRWAVELDWQW